MRPKIAPEVYVALREQGLSNRQIADKLRVDEASVRRGLKAAEYRPYLIPGWVQQRLGVDLEKPIRLNVEKDGPGAVTADWHLPLTDFELLNIFIDHARDIGATKWLVIAGDYFNLDGLSRFDFKQKTADLPEELFAGSHVMEQVLQTFERVIFSWGNHDARVHKALGFRVDFVTAMAMMFPWLDPELLGRIEFTNLDHVIVDSPRGPYYIAHPKAYTSIPLSNARKLASKELMHVFTGHSHHSALGKDVSNTFVCAELGGFFAAEKTQYLQRTTAYPKWTNGYAFIDNEGWPVVEADGWSSRIGRRA